MRRYGKNWNSPENKKKRRDASQKAIRKRWDDYHDSISDAPVRSEPVTPGPYELTFKDLATGRVEVLTMTYCGNRQYKVEVNGKPWKVCGWTGTVDRFRKSCVSASVID